MAAARRDFTFPLLGDLTNRMTDEPSDIDLRAFMFSLIFAGEEVLFSDPRFPFYHVPFVLSC